MKIKKCDEKKAAQRDDERDSEAHAPTRENKANQRKGEGYM
jgi:hypothetical protein